MGVVLLDLVEDEVRGRAERHVAGHAPGHTGVQERDDLALSVDDCSSGVALSREVRVAEEVEEGALPALPVQIVASISLELGELRKGQVGLLPKLGHDVASVAVLVLEVGVCDCSCVEPALDLEEVVGRVFEDGLCEGLERRENSLRGS